MPEALYPAEETAQDVSFELDAFALIGADRLELTGRWFGVRGRRFVRPMLTLSIGDESQRSLADLEHKPWAAEDGQPWTAAFPLEADAAELEGVELAVGPDITLSLPLPSGAGGRRGTRDRSTRPQPSERSDAAKAQARTQALVAERDGLQHELDNLQRELEQVQADNGQLRSVIEHLSEERERWRAQRGELNAEHNRLDAMLDRLRAERDRLRVGMDRLQSDRNALRAERDGLQAERDQLRDQRDRLRTERGVLHDERDHLRGERDLLVSAEHKPRVPDPGQRTVTAHAPRYAARRPGQRADWAGRLLAVIVLLGVIAALLILVRP